jgi:hypothetical protein
VLALMRDLTERRRAEAERPGSVESGPGVLFSSGLIAGGAIAGITVAAVAAAVVQRAEAAQIPAADYLATRLGLHNALGAFATSDLVAVLVFFGLGAMLYRVARR